MNNNIKDELDVLDKMIDHVQRKIRSNENIIGAINSTYEYETFFGTKTNQTEIDEMKLNVQALGVLLTYRSDLMNYAVGIGSKPSLTLPQGFNF